MTVESTHAAKTPAKKTAAKTTKKAPAKKTAAKKTETVTQTPPVTDTPPVTATPDPVVAVADPSGLQPEDSKSSTSIAQDILNGSHRWGSGRDRVALLERAGHDSGEVLKEISRLRAKARRAAQS